MGKNLAYYNAGSAALVLLIVFLIIGTFVYCRVRRKRLQLPSTTTMGINEESIPLTSQRGMADDEGDSMLTSRRGLTNDEEDSRRTTKGKGRARDTGDIGSQSSNRIEERERIFDVGESDDEDYQRNR